MDNESLKFLETLKNNQSEGTVDMCSKEVVRYSFNLLKDNLNTLKQKDKVHLLKIVCSLNTIEYIKLLSPNVDKKANNMTMDKVKTNADAFFYVRKFYINDPRIIKMSKGKITTEVNRQLLSIEKEISYNAFASLTDDVVKRLVDFNQKKYM